MEQPFNPPADDTEAFDDEWWSVRCAVASVLADFGVADDYGRGDYLVSESRNVSRGISVVLTSDALLRPELVGALRRALASAPQPYSVHLADENYASDMFIEPGRVLVGPEAMAFLPRLGLSMATPRPA